MKRIERIKRVMPLNVKMSAHEIGARCNMSPHKVALTIKWRNNGDIEIAGRFANANLYRRVK